MVVEVSVRKKNARNASETPSLSHRGAARRVPGLTIDVLSEVRFIQRVPFSPSLFLLSSVGKSRHLRLKTQGSCNF